MKDTEIRIVKFIEKNGRARAKDIEELLGIPHTIALEELHKLENIGLLRSERRGMSVYYIAVDIYSQLLNTLNLIETNYLTALEQISEIKKVLKGIAQEEEMRII